MQPVSATPELALPGLETPEIVTQPQTGHWIERGPQKRLMVFSGRSHKSLAERIAEQLGLELGEIELDTFPNGETYCRYDESIRGADLFLVQTGCDPVDRNLMELVLMIQAAKLASAKRITAVIPWFPYARQDRKAKPREPISARLVADMLQLAGADRVLTMDLHAGQIQGFFTIPVDHMTSLPLFARHFRDLGLAGADRPDREARAHDGAHRRAAPRRDDHERVRRRLRLGDLRRREPALLGNRRNHAGWRRACQRGANPRAEKRPVRPLGRPRWPE